MSYILASFVLFLNRVVGLIFTPYKTMRRISTDRDISQIVIILTIVWIFFMVIEPLRFVLYIIDFGLTVAFFVIFGRIYRGGATIRSTALLISYTIIPTLIWFVTNAMLYVLLPPPRSMTVLGKAFSIVYISFSVSLLCWKAILLYLAARFSLRQGFYRVMYTIVLYLTCVTTAAYIAYVIGWGKIPFI